MASGDRCARALQQAVTAACDARTKSSDMRLAGAAVLVTGGAGFIGSHLVDHLIDRGVSRLVVVDTLWLGARSNLASARARRPDLEFVKEDAGDGDAMRTIIERRRIDVVFNLATKPLGYSFTDPRGAYMTSVDIAANLAELLRAGAFGRLVHYSTSEIYGDAQTLRCPKITRRGRRRLTRRASWPRTYCCSRGCSCSVFRS